MELSISALKLHGKWSAIGIMRDVTERKLLETEIQDDRKYAENIVETVREPLVVLNSDLKILTANHSFYETFKVTPEETTGNFIYDVGNRQWDNRAFFDEELERFAHSRMFPVSIVMADVNGLKAVNDALGHEAGDSTGGSRYRGGIPR